LGNQDKRQTKRVNQYIQIRYFFGSNTSPIQVYTEDISSGGIRIHNPFKIDERYQFPMDIVLDSESDTLMKVIARVAWQRKIENKELWEMGLEFVQMENADRELLEKFVEAIEPE